MLTNESGSSPETVDPEASTTSPDAKPSESSTDKGAKAPLNSMKEVLDKAFEKAEATLVFDEPKEAEEKSPDSKPEDGQETDESKAEKDGQAEEKKESDATADVLSNQYSKRPEWVEATKILGEDGAKKVRPILRKMMEREQQLVSQVNTLKPAVDIVGELKRLTGGEDEFNSMRHMVEAYSNDPAASVPMLETLLLDAKKRAGLEFVSDDLKTKLTKIDQREADGLLTAEDAKEMRDSLREVEKSRAQARQSGQKVQQTEAEAQAAQDRAFHQRRANAINDWEANIRQKDPSFGDATDRTDPNHGESVCDQVLDAINLLTVTNPRATPNDWVAEAERVYRIARRRFGTGTNGKTQRAVTTSGPSTKPAPKRDKNDWRGRLDDKVHELVNKDD